MARKRIKSHICPNCDFAYSTNTEKTNFCPHCGQENHNPRQPVFHYIKELIESIFHFDNKTWVSLKTLLLHPGKMTKDYIENRRGRYTPPVRIFIFTIAIFLIIGNLFNSYSDDKSFGKEQLTINEKLSQMNDTIKISFANPPLSMFVKNNEVSISEIKRLTLLPESQIGLWLKSAGFSDNFLNRFSAKLLWRYFNRKMTDLEYSHYAGRIFNYALILKIPLLALIFFLFFYRKGYMYYDSVILSLHVVPMLCIYSLLLSFIQLIFRLDPDSPWGIYFLFGCLFFLIIIPATKKVFEFSWISTILRSMITVVLYIIVQNIFLDVLSLYIFKG